MTGGGADELRARDAELGNRAAARWSAGASPPGGRWSAARYLGLSGRSGDGLGFRTSGPGETTPSGRSPDDIVISVITPVRDPSAEVLDAMLRSVLAQTHTAWEHCLVDDGSTMPWVRERLDRAAADDQRVRVHYREQAGGIAAASNDAVALATGEFVAFLDHDDELRADALARMAAAIAAVEDVDYLYSDEDKIDDRGRHRDPFLKPAWSPDRFRCQMYTCHLSVLRRELVEAVGGLRSEYDGAQDWDLVLRVTERARRVVHVPEVLYHWRTLASSVAGSGPAAKPWAYAAGERAVADHVARTAVPGEAVPMPGFPGMLAIAPRLAEHPLVSIVIPTGGQRRTVRGVDTILVENAVRSVVEHSTYVHYEIVVVVDAHVPDTTVDAVRAVAGDRLTVVGYDRPFNFSDKINVGAAHGRGEHILLLNDDVEVVPGDGGRSDWIEQLLVYAVQPGVGAAGAKLHFADGAIQHAGIVFPGGKPTNAYRGWPADAPGYFGNALLPGDYLALTGACLLTPRAVFEEVGGLCVDLPNNYNDVDYGLKLWSLGLRSVHVPTARLVHHESASRTTDVVRDEMERLRRRWGRVLDADPFFHPLLPDTAGFVPPMLDPDGRLGPVAGTLAYDWRRVRESLRDDGAAGPFAAAGRRLRRLVSRRG